jgi:hypothetical protein
MHLEKGMCSEYHSITNTWDVHNLSMDAVKRDLRQKGMLALASRCLVLMYKVAICRPST